MAQSSSVAPPQRAGASSKQIGGLRERNGGRNFGERGWAVGPIYWLAATATVRRRVGAGSPGGPMGSTRQSTEASS